MKEFNKGDTNGDGKMTREEWIQKFGNDDMFETCVSPMAMMSTNAHDAQHCVPRWCCDGCVYLLLATISHVWNIRYG